MSKADQQTPQPLSRQPAPLQAEGGEAECAQAQPNPSTHEACRLWRAQTCVVLAIFFGVLVVDQCIKFWVKTHMYMHESIRVTDWFYLLFTENNGMAFGMQLFDKIFLTVGRLVLVALVAWYVGRCIRQGVKWGYLICLALILAGAFGNIIDCVFYGLLFDAPMPPSVAQLVPFGTGYSTWFYGRVVDMFYFPLVEWDWPMWLPWVGGNHFIFFSPIFNFADASISCGVIALILFYRSLLMKE